MINKIFTILLITISVNCFAQKNIVKVGFVPWEKPEIMKKFYSPLINYLSKELGIEFAMYFPETYDSVTELLKKKSLDLVFYTPKSYVSAKNILPKLKYMVTNKTKNDDGSISDFYEGVIIVHKNSKFKKIEDLKNHRFGFTNPDSSSGFAYPASMMFEKGINYKEFFSKVFWLEKHHRVVGAIAKKSIDGGATWDQYLKNAIKDHGDIFRVIAKTAPIPNDPLVCAAHFDEKTRKIIVDLLVKLEPDHPVMKEMIKNGFPDIGFSKRNDAFYDVVRRLKK